MLSASHLIPPAKRIHALPDSTTADFTSRNDCLVADQSTSSMLIFSGLLSGAVFGAGFGASPATARPRRTASASANVRRQVFRARLIMSGLMVTAPGQIARLTVIYIGRIVVGIQ